MSKYPVLIALAVFILFFAKSLYGQEQDSQLAREFEGKVRPLLTQYCGKCHTSESGDGFNFLGDTHAGDVQMLEQLREVAGVIASESMPPNDATGIKKEDRQLLMEWFDSNVDFEASKSQRIAPYVVEIFEDRNGSFWFGTMSSGVARFDGSKLAWFSKKDGLPSNTVASIAEDHAGVIFVGTHGGVAKFADGQFRKVDLANDGSANAESTETSSGVSSDQEGTFWASQGRRVYRRNRVTFENFPLPIQHAQIKSFAILPGDASMMLADRKGRLWFGTDGDGIYRFDGNSFTHFTTSNGLCSNNVNDIVEDQQGRIWVACMQSYQPRMTGDGGLCRFNGTRFETFPNLQGLTRNDIYTIYETRSGDVWVGATGVGAYRFRNDSVAMFSQTDRPRWTRNFGIQSILEDKKGKLWFGFSGGLFHFDGREFKHVSRQDLVEKGLGNSE